MDNNKFEQVAALVEHWDYEWGCGPFENCLPETENLQKLNRLTGRDWTAENVRLCCFEYSSHNSLAETVYFLFHGNYPPLNNISLVFFRPGPGVDLDPETVYEKYRLGGRLEDLLPLPLEEITEALRALPGFREHQWKGFEPDCLRLDCLDQPDPWSDVSFHAFWYGGRGNPRPDHLLCLSCRNLAESQIQALTNLLAGFGLPVRYREEDHAY